MEKKVFFLIALIAFLLYFPSLFNFYSHDDFFHLTISQARSVGEFLNFFNPVSAPSGFGFYRPLTTQAFYFLSLAFFDLNPMPLHVISFAVFFAVIFLVFKLANEFLESKKTALLATFLYAVSATHFGHLYYLGAFQELGLAFFFFLSVWGFIKLLKQGGKGYYLLSLAAFLGALLSKEFAVTLPVLLIVVLFYTNLQGKNLLPVKKTVVYLIPFFLVLGVYLYLHIFYYGLAQGDSYLWEFSPKVFNTLFWYTVWSLGLPEMLVDFVGPGLRPVPNLFLNYGKEIKPIIGLFIALLIMLAYAVFKAFKKEKLCNLEAYLFFGLWFLLTLAPVLFLPWHKFTYELTVPLFGFTGGVGLLVSRFGKPQVFAFAAVYLVLSFLTTSLTSRTHWITQGGQAARNVKNYLDQNFLTSETKYVLFYDTEKDANLPWKPSLQLQNILSKEDFFQVFSGGRIKPLYGAQRDVNVESSLVKAEARKFLNYDP